MCKLLMCVRWHLLSSGVSSVCVCGKLQLVFNVGALPSGLNKDGCVVYHISGESAIYVEDKSSFTFPPLTDCTLKACHFIVA